MIRPLVTSVVLPAIVAAAWFVCAQPPAPAQPNGLKPFMQQKLDHSKAILEGLALEDYQSIAKNAQDLSLLSLESTWNVLSTQEYLQHSQDFRRAVKQIIEAAHEKNVDKATLGYVDLTIRCVECHKYLRETRKNGK